MAIYLCVHIPVSVAVEEGSEFAGLHAVQLSSSEVSRIRDLGLAEASEPYLSTFLIEAWALTGILGLDVRRLTFDAILESLIARRDRIVKIREVARRGALTWAVDQSLSPPSEEDLSLDAPPRDVCVPGEPRSTTASVLVRWARRAVVLVQEAERGQGARADALMDAWLGVPDPLREQMERDRRFRDWVPSDVADAVERAVFADSVAGRVEARERAVGELVARLGTPSQVDRHVHGALPDDELVELEDADAFLGVPSPVAQEGVAFHAWFGRGGPPAAPSIPHFVVDADHGWSSVGASADVRTWESAAPLRDFAAANAGRVQIGYRRASGRIAAEAHDATAVVVEGTSCLGSRIARQYTWLRPKVDPGRDLRVDPMVRALVRRRGSPAQRECLLRGGLSLEQVLELEAKEVFEGFPVPDGVLVEFPSASGLREEAAPDGDRDISSLVDPLRHCAAVREGRVRIEGTPKRFWGRVHGTGIFVSAEGCLGTRFGKYLIWPDSLVRPSST